MTKDRFFMWETFFETGRADDPYMTRLTAGNLSLHIMWRGDADQAPHDHARGFTTYPLTPYVEEVPDDTGALQKRLVKAFKPHHRPAEYRHRIVGRYVTTETYNPGSGMIKMPELIAGHGPIVTLVWWEKPWRRWGFWPMDAEGVRRWVWWRSYLFGELDDEQGKTPTYTVTLKPNNRTLWRIWCTWILQTKYRNVATIPKFRPLRKMLMHLKADWRYSAAMVELAQENCDFMPPYDYEPMTPHDAIDVDKQYWESSDDD